MKLLPYGEDALLLELDEASLVPAVHAAVAARDDVAEAVAGATTVLVVSAPRHLDRLRHELPVLVAACVGRVVETSAVVTLPVAYDGPDLAAVAEAGGLSVAEVIELHAAGDYVVRFCGFSPGFAYLDGLHARLQVARRAEPRVRVPAGAVGVAGEFTGVYPRSSPGGWQLLGRTSADLWDARRNPPALLTPGTRVRFEPVAP